MPVCMGRTSIKTKLAMATAALIILAVLLIGYL